MPILRGVICLVGLCLLWPAAIRAGQDPVVRLATLEWPPYVSASLPDGGVHVALVHQTFDAAGYRLQVQPLPWRNAVAAGTNAPAFDGYFPVYLTAARRRECYLSGSIGISTLVLVKRAASPVVVHDLDDLSRYLVGVVNGYVNSAPFDANVMSGKQQIDRADNDEQNLLKLLNGHLDLVVIDRDVLHWLQRHAASLSSSAGQLEVLDPPLEQQDMYICFKRTPNGQKLSDAFMRGLRGVNVETFDRNYLSTLPAQ